MKNEYILTEDTNYKNIADAIRSSTGHRGELYPSQMADRLYGFVPRGGSEYIDGSVVNLNSSTVRSVAPYKFNWTSSYGYMSPLKSVILPECTYVGARAFANNEVLVDVSLPKIDEIPEGLFLGSGPKFRGSSLPGIRLIDWYPTKLGDSAFQSGCVVYDNLYEVFRNVTQVGDYCFNGTRFNDNNGTECANLVIHGSFSCGTRSFGLGTNSAVKTLEFTGHISGPCKQFLYDVRHMKTLKINEIDILGEKALDGCWGVETVEINHVLEFGKGPFYGCESLTKVIIRNTDVVPPLKENPANSTGGYWYNTHFSNGDIGFFYVDDALLDTYKAAPYWSNISEQIKPISELTE